MGIEKIRSITLGNEGKLRPHFLVRSFRSVDEALRDLKVMSDEIEDLIRLAKNQQKQLASFLVNAAELKFRTFEVDTRELKQSPKINPASPDKVVVPQAAVLKKNYQVLEEHFQRFRDLKAMEIDFEVRFKDQKNLPKLLSEIRRMKVALEQSTKAALGVIGEIARKNVPKQFSTFLKRFAPIIEQGIDYQSAKTYLYIHIRDGFPVYSHYLHLKNATSDEGIVKPDLFIVFSYKVTKGSDANTFVTVLYEFEPPDRFDLGKPITDVKTAARMLAMQLEFDNFATMISAVPITDALKTTEFKKSMFSYQEYISAIQSSPDQLSFVLNKTYRGKKVDRSIVDKVGMQLYTELGPFRRNTQIKMLMRPREEQGVPIISFYFNRGGGEPAATADDLQFLKDRFGLSTTTLNKIVSDINRDAST